MPNFDINAFHVGQNYVLEASAGTGKTYNIVEIVDRLISSGVDMSKILIVTYTEKAAGELKNRIREKIAGIDVDSASIGTIHSFCQNTLKEFCIASGKLSNLEVVDESECRTFLQQYIRDNLMEDIQFMKKEYGTDCEDSLINNMTAILKNYYLDQGNEEDNSIIALDISKQPTALRPNAANSTKKAKTKEYINYLASTKAKDYFAMWQQEKEKRNVKTFNDMIRDVREEVMQNGPLLEKLRGKYTYAIIDEFQDTNQKQWDIFKKVFMCEGHHLIVVGDPKQSIYSFQGADLSVYQNAKKEIIASGGYCESLTCNYRASESIVECTNRFFENENALSTEMGFTPSTCGKNKLSSQYDGKTLPAYWIYEDKESELPAGDMDIPDEESDGIPVKKEMPQDRYANIICQTVIDCCSLDKSGHTKLRITEETTQSDGTTAYNMRNVSFKDFAVLARSRSEMAPIERAMENCGIPFVRYKDTRLFTGAECAQWICILDAVSASDFTGKNRSKFKKALFTSFFDFSLSELNSSAFDMDNSVEFQLFSKWRRFAQNHQWEDLISSIISDSFLEQNLQSVNNLKSLGIFRQLGEYCLSFLSENKSISKLVLNLKKLKKNENGDEEEGNNLTEISTDFDCVKVMTIHAAKGLEFPVVISVSGFIGNKNSNEAYIYHDITSGKKLLSLDKPDGYEATECKPEWERLFYVAYTRAKYVLMLPIYDVDKNGLKTLVRQSIVDYKNNNLGYYYSLQDNGLSTDELQVTVKKILNENKKVTPVIVSKVNQEQVLKDLIAEKKNRTTHKYAYSSLSHGHKAAIEVMTDETILQNEDEEPEENGLSHYDTTPKMIPCDYNPTRIPVTVSDNFPAGTGLGNAIHDVLEVMDYTLPVDSPANRKLIEECFRRQGFRQLHGWVDDTIHLLEEVMEAKLPIIHGAEATGDSFTLSQIDFSNRKNEVEFNYNKDNEKLKNFFNGFMDLVFKQGEYYAVLDWKSDRLRDDFSSYADGTILKAHIDELYSIQRVLYSHCLIEWLKIFYPELSEQEIFKQHFGGVYYVCLRGCNKETGNGIYAQTWADFEDLEQSYQLILKERVEN